MSDQAVAAIMEALTGRNTLSKNTTVRHAGSEIILPIINEVPMSAKEGIYWLQKRMEEDETTVAIYEEMQGAVLDCAVALDKAIKEIYGYSNGVAIQSFFGSRPPVTIGVPVSATETVQVVWGRVEIQGIDGYIQLSLNPTGAQPTLIVAGEVKKKHRENVSAIIRKAQEMVKAKSIYRGKAVKLSFDWYREGQDFDPMRHAPQFLNLTGVKEDDLMFSESVINSLNVGLFAPIENAQACRDNGIPLKRGVLLSGPYGTGKTMTAYVSALKAIRNDWTFIYLDSVEDLREGLEFAAKYAPAVVFAEDLDRLISGKRSMKMDDVLNILDGIDTKGKDVITVFTTNHIENINPAMLRMGRLDTLVEVLPPDAATVERLVKLYARDLMEDGADLAIIGKALEGNIPAFIRETVERAKLAAIYRIGSGDIKGKVRQEDLLASADAMKNHANMLKPREDDFREVSSVVVDFSGAVSNGKTKKIAQA
jgi:transitional endoplasmic reticulum ATPase